MSSVTQIATTLNLHWRSAKISVIIGTLASVALGASIPVYFTLFGEMLTVFVDMNHLNKSGLDNATDSLLDQMPLYLPSIEKVNTLVVYFTVLGAAVWLLAYIASILWRLSSLSMILSLMKNQLERSTPIVRNVNQNTSVNDANRELTSRLPLHKLTYLRPIALLSAYIGSIIVGFVYHWTLTLITSAISLLMILVAVCMSKIGERHRDRVNDAYSSAGEVVHDTLDQLKSNSELNTDCDQLVQRYVKQLNLVVKATVKKDVLHAVGVGLRCLLFFGTFAVVWVYGAKIVHESSDFTIGDIMTVLLAIMFGTIALEIAVNDVLGIGTIPLSELNDTREDENKFIECSSVSDNDNRSSKKYEKPSDKVVTKIDVSKSPRRDISVTLSLMKFSKRDWFYICVGLLAETGVGGFITVFAVILCNSLFEFDDSHKVKIFVMHYIGFGLTLFISWVAHGLMFGLVGARLTRRVRKSVFRAILKYDQTSLNDLNDKSSELQKMLSLDAEILPAAGAIHIGNIVQYLSSYGAGIIVGLYHNWSLTLVILAVVIPVHLLYLLEQNLSKSNMTCNKFCVCPSEIVVDNYQNIDEQKYRKSQKRHLLLWMIPYSFIYGAVPFLTAVVFYFGAIQVTEWATKPVLVFIPFSSIILGLLSAHLSSSYFPFYRNGVFSARRVLAFIDEHSPSPSV